MSQQPVPFLSIAEKMKAEADQDIVEVLEHVLEQAKSGEISAICGIKVHRYRGFAHVRAGDLSISQLIGFMEIAKHELLAIERDRPTETDDAG